MRKLSVGWWFPLAPHQLSLQCDSALRDRCHFQALCYVQWHFVLTAVPPLVVFH